ncbi:carbohydrate ABC transporter permease [Enterococcus innesii]|uniref:carbohydrate ABC transporter permease n=1 Tax=Enterococcus innesii TaxID=2839759 RepID=UPI002090524D|nr:sugar ABC transporter permease [Enterococcus innesii]MCO5496752.1 sugar ABC transporter permease [Enterococcus innesii]
MRKSTTKWAWLFLTPQLVGLIIFSLIPVAIAIGLSFMSWDGFGARTFVGIQNYINQFANPDFWTATYNTLLYTLFTVPIGLSLALVLAVVLNKRTGKNVYRLFFFMPVVTSSVSVSVMWMWILNGDIGILNQVLGMIGIQGPNWLTDTRIVMLSIAMLSIWWQLGYNMVIFLAGIQNISKSYYEAAEMDGASKLQQFLKSPYRCFHQRHSFYPLWRSLVRFKCLTKRLFLLEVVRGKPVIHLFITFISRPLLIFALGQVQQARLSCL